MPDYPIVEPFYHFSLYPLDLMKSLENRLYSWKNRYGYVGENDGGRQPKPENRDGEKKLLARTIQSYWLAFRARTKTGEARISAPSFPGFLFFRYVKREALSKGEDGRGMPAIPAGRSGRSYWWLALFSLLFHSSGQQRGPGNESSEETSHPEERHLSL
uniref:Uncharacterized protein n=1 Tax=Candidatus Kentrum sp. LFY TaxID=2126342 RepID=A0A450UQ11_9GAMM|nr:MAG: hypothetical protein BECKLFY1418B_GA0070995_10612 [Candidatus Kentron sp. LFY]